MTAIIEIDDDTDLATQAQVDERPRTPFEAGISYELSNAEYHSIDALSSTGVKRILQSPMHYKWDRENPKPPTPAMAIGTAVHMAILEPDKFLTDVISEPEDAPKKPTAAQMAAAKPSAAAMASMQFWSEFAKHAGDKLVLSAKDYQRVCAMTRAALRHPAVEWLLSEGRAEVSYQWMDAHYNVPCKARFDWLRPDGIAADVKTTLDASPEEFLRAIQTYRYHIQQAWYNSGHEHVSNESLRGFAFIAVENVAPYGVAVYTIEPNAIAFAVGRCDEAVMRYKHARDSGYWRGYSERINPLTLSRWATTLTPTT